MAKTPITQAGSAYIVAMAILVVALIGALGAVFWQNQARESARQTKEVTNLSQTENNIKHVIHISIDGLRSDYVNSKIMPTLYSWVKGGASTLNARTDPDFTNTLPNHVTQFTGRQVLGKTGHKVDYNEDKGRSVHQEAGFYVSSVFDVVHDNGGGVIVLADKPKFDVIERTWNDNGKSDTTDSDNGTKKIDYYENIHSSTTISTLVSFMNETDGPVFAFYHIKDPDSAGHVSGWATIGYEVAVRKSDSILKQIADELRKTNLADTTAIIVTADHGGATGEGSHADAANRENYTVPFIIYGPGISKDADLYELNKDDRVNPGVERNGVKSIRTGEVANTALDLLGLSSVPGSEYNTKQDLDY